MENILDEIMDKPTPSGSAKSIYISGDDFTKISKAVNKLPGHTPKSFLLGAVDVVEMIQTGVITAIQTSKLSEKTLASIESDLKNAEKAK